jgi:nucleotide-binding universal stress UspA family protein
MRVLIGVDGSLGSFAAVQFVGRLLTASQDEITLYYSPPPVYVRTVADATAAEARLQDFLASTVFDRAKQHLPKDLRAAAKTITGTREPRQGLLLAADECRADLIVVGARGVGPATAPAPGNLARHVVHHAPVPVLVVRGAALLASGALHVMLAADALLESQRIAKVLSRFSWPADTSAQTITVVESAAQGQIPQWLSDLLDDQQLAALGMGRFAGADEEAARRRADLKSWQATLPAIFGGHEPLVTLGHAGEQIVEASLANRADLVAVGARRQGAVRRLLLGSTSEHVLNHAPCSVLIVREHEQP